MAKLTNKQFVFVQEYLRCFNATEAARRAGYRGKAGALAVIGWENLRKPYIAAVIKAELEQKAMGAEEVLMRLAEQARGTVEDFYTAEDGGYRLDLTKAREAGKMHLVKAITPTAVGVKLELHDAQAALALIGKHLKLFTDVHEVTGKDGGPIKVEDARAALAEKMAAQAERERAAAGDHEPDAGTGGEASV